MQEAAAEAAAGGGGGAAAQPPSPSQPPRGAGAGVSVLLNAVATDLSGAVLGLQRPPGVQAEALSPLRRIPSALGTPRSASTPRAAPPS